MQAKSWTPQLSDCPPSLLRTLVVFAEEGGVSKTAESLGMEQPAVSRRLSVFLKAHGTSAPLLERSQHRLRLTERGKAVLPTIREVLAQYDALLANLEGRQPMLEVVRLALGDFAAQLYLPQILAKAREQERWRLETRIMRGRERITGVLEGRLDLALVTHDLDDIVALTAGRRELTTDTVARYDVVVIARASTKAGAEMSSWPAERVVSVDKLASWPLVGLDEQSGLCQKLQRHLRGRAALQLVQECQPGGWLLAREYARHKLGVGLLPSPLVTTQDRRDFVVRNLAGTFSVEVVLVARQGKRTQAQGEVVELLRKAGVC